MIDIFNDPLFTPFLGNLAVETVAKRQIVAQISYSFGPLMNKIRNSSTPQLLSTLEESANRVRDLPPTPTVQSAVDKVLKLVDDMRTVVNSSKAEVELQVDVDSIIAYGRAFASPKLGELMAVRCSHRIREGGTCPSCYNVKVKEAARYAAQKGWEWTKRYGRIELSESTKKLME